MYIDIVCPYCTFEVCVFFVIVIVSASSLRSFVNVCIVVI